MEVLLELLFIRFYRAEAGQGLHLLCGLHIHPNIRSVHMCIFIYTHT